VTDPPVVVVYCEGQTPGDPHDRFIVAAYQRAHVTPTTTPALWAPLSQHAGIRLRAAERDVARWPTSKRTNEVQHRYRCDRCDYDELRNDDPRDVGRRMFAVFDGLGGACPDPLEISVRALVRLIARNTL
jgi:hypothetical protein